MQRHEPLPEAYKRDTMQIAHRFRVGEHDYQAHPLSALEQIHMARRLAPIVLSILKPENGRAAVLQRLAKVANLTADGQGEAPAMDGVATNDAIELALSVLQTAADADEEMVNGVIRKVMQKIMRVHPEGGAIGIWWDKPGFEGPTKNDIDGFILLRIVATYLSLEFRQRIVEYIASLNLKPGPAFTAAMAGAGIPQPPGPPVR